MKILNIRKQTNVHAGLNNLYEHFKISIMKLMTKIHKWMTFINIDNVAKSQMDLQFNNEEQYDTSILN